MTRRLAASVLLVLAVLPLGSAAAAEQPASRRAVVVVLDDASMEDLLAVPGFAALAAAGGGGLLSNTVPLRDAVALLSASGVPMQGLEVVDEGSVASTEGGASPEALLRVAERLQQELERSDAGEVLVVLASSSPSGVYEGTGDPLGGIVVAQGAPGDLSAAMRERAAAEAAGTVTSDSTRREGVVTSLDVPETVVGFLGALVSDDSGGEVIRTISGPPPFDLHERYLAQRRMYVPIGIAAGLYVTLVGLAAIGLLALRRRAPAWMLEAVSALTLSVSALVVGLIAAGHLPTLSYGTVVPFLVVVTGGAAVAVALLARQEPLRPAPWIGAGVLAFFGVEALLGWTAALTPFLGGSQLDGGRFYGLPNVLIGLLVGAPLYLGYRRRTAVGVALLVGTALFAGLPSVGANLGASVTLFATAGLWLALRERERLGVWKGVGVVAGITVLGAAAILVAHRLSPVPTHVTRFEEAAGGLAGVWQTFTDRLLVGWQLIERNPFALIPALGLVVVAGVILRPPPSIRDGFEGRPAWRDAMLAIALGGIVAYVANDSGAAACGQAFAMSLSGTLFIAIRVALAARTGKMEGP